MIFTNLEPVQADFTAFTNSTFPKLLEYDASVDLSNFSAKFFASNFSGEEIVFNCPIDTLNHTLDLTFLLNESISLGEYNYIVKLKNAENVEYVLFYGKINIKQAPKWN